MTEILKLLLFSFFAVLYLFLISKIMGKKQLTIEDMGIKIEKSALPCYLIVDGHISYSALRELNKDVK